MYRLIKAARFVLFAIVSTFLVFMLEDVPDYQELTKRETNELPDTLLSEATVPRITVITRVKLTAVRMTCNELKHIGADMPFQPSAEIAVMGVKGWPEIILRKKIMKPLIPNKLLIEKNKNVCGFIREPI
jgi:acetyl-CoA carboxylase carboxyltransferase component